MSTIGRPQRSRVEIPDIEGLPWGNENHSFIFTPIPDKGPVEDLLK